MRLIYNRQFTAAHEDSSMPRILIIDDSPTEVYQLTAILKKHGYSVDVATTGGGAKSHPPDLILMDVVMPEVNGFQERGAAPPSSDVTCASSDCFY